MKHVLIYISALLTLVSCNNKDESSKAHNGERHRVLVSTDIGGTDPDDNQSMVHLMMYSDKFDLEGLVSSPSYGAGSKEEILRMIEIYEQDYPTLKSNYEGLLSPDSLRSLCAQGRQGLAPFKGYDKPTEGSELIIKQARKEDKRPLYVLVWGTLDDVAQALHDAPDIAQKIRIHYIGGPNKKWGVNSHAYIAQNFPNIWMIENNATYRGIITNSNDTSVYQAGFYDHAIRDAGALGNDFTKYYNGIVKMGDTPSLLYMMNGDPDRPESESWGGQFEKTSYTARRVLNHPISIADTVPVYAVTELNFSGPVANIDPDSSCFTAIIDKQMWDGYYIGEGKYCVRYAPKAPASLTYKLTSEITELNGLEGSFTVGGQWPGKPHKDNYIMGNNWYTDCQDPALFEGKWHGAQTVRRWQKEIMDDWASRFATLRK